MVHGLAAQLGGGLRHLAELGKGTRVDLYLPLAARGSAEERVHVAGAAGESSRQLSILLVDDEDLVRFATAEMMRELGHRVTEVSNGPDALDQLVNGLDVDAVVTDYKMPRMDGSELARRVRESRPSLPVLIITGYTGIGKEVLNLPRLAKPFGQAELAAALGSLIAKSGTILAFRSRSHSPKR